MGRLLPEHVTAVSLLDRLLHHAIVMAIEGESFRMRQARSKRGAARPRKLRNSSSDGDFYLATTGDTHLTVDMAPLARRQRRALPWEARAAHAGPLASDCR